VAQRASALIDFPGAQRRRDIGGLPIGSEAMDAQAAPDALEVVTPPDVATPSAAAEVPTPAGTAR